MDFIFLEFEVTDNISRCEMEFFAFNDIIQTSSSCCGGLLVWGFTWMRILPYNYCQQFSNTEFWCFPLDQSKEHAHLHWELRAFHKLAMSSLSFPAVHSNLTITENYALNPRNRQTTCCSLSWCYCSFCLSFKNVVLLCLYWLWTWSLKSPKCNPQNISMYFNFYKENKANLAGKLNFL